MPSSDHSNELCYENIMISSPVFTCHGGKLGHEEVQRHRSVDCAREPEVGACSPSTIHGHASKLNCADGAHTSMKELLNVGAQVWT